MASVSEPFLLSSYAKHRPSAVAAKSGVFVSHARSRGPAHEEGYVTVAVQGEGIHILDVSDIHPVLSHTLGPTARFACPAVSVVAADGRCTTCAVMDARGKAGAEAQRVCVWRESLENPSPSGSNRDGRTVHVPCLVGRVYATAAAHLVLVSPAGELLLADLDVEIKHRRPPSSTKLLASFHFHKECNLAAGDAPPGSAVIVLLSQDTDKPETRIEAVAVGDTGFVNLGDFRAPVEPDTIATTSCSPSGHLTILTKSGIWHQFHLVRANSAAALSLTRPCPPIELSPSAVPPTHTKLLALSASHVLMCTLRPDTDTVQLLLWDTAYAVVLAVHTFSTPAASATAGLAALEGAGPGTALLVLRAAVFAVPYTVPQTSAIARAMGRHAASAAYLVHPHAARAAGVGRGLAPAHEALLGTMRAALAKDDAEAASMAFLGATTPGAGAQTGTETVDWLDDGFVAAVMAVIWDSRGKDGRVGKLHCPDVFSWFLERGAIRRDSVDGDATSGSTEEGGVVRALIRNGNLALLLKAVEFIRDISETDIIFFLAVVSRTSPASHSMQVDTTPGEVPFPDAVLASCVRAPASAPPLRLAMHRYLTEPAALVVILDTLSGWLETSGVGHYFIQEPQHPVMPPVAKTLFFLQCLLDATSLTLLAHKPAHARVRRLLRVVQPLLDVLGEDAQLRGPLLPFARRAREQEVARETKAGGRVDWQKRRKEKKEAAYMEGAYRLEELVL